MLRRCKCIHTRTKAFNFGRSLIIYKRHVILVRVECGSNIHTRMLEPRACVPPAPSRISACIRMFDIYTRRQ